MNRQTENLRKIYLQADEMIMDAELIRDYEVYGLIYNRARVVKELVKDQLMQEGRSEEAVEMLTEEWIERKF